MTRPTTDFEAPRCSIFCIMWGSTVSDELLPHGSSHRAYPRLYCAPSGLLRHKKSAQLAIGLLGRFFGKVVAARQRDGAANVGGIVPPHLGWFVIAPDRPGSPPQQQDRAFDFASGGKILGVHVEVYSEGRAIVLAHGVDGGRVAEAAYVFGQRFLTEKAQPFLGFGELAGDEKVRIRTHQPLRQVERLDHEEPMI